MLTDLQVGAAFSLALLLGVPDAGRADGCLIEILPLFTRSVQASFVVVRATPDTLSVGVYYHVMTREGVSRIPAMPSQQGREVFGQVLELVSAYGPDADQLAGYRRIVAVWWAVESACLRWFPRSARRLATGEAFILQAPRAATAWIGDMPTYDVDLRDYVFIPGANAGAGQASGAQRDMSARELAEMFPFLPTQEGLDRDRAEALAPILKWGSAKPERWRIYPANWILCNARLLATPTSDPCS